MWRNFHLNFEVQVLISGFNPKHGGWFSCSNLSLEEAFHCLGKGCLVPRVSVYYQSQSGHLELLERDFTPWLQNWPRNGSKRSEQLKSNLTDMNKSPHAHSAAIPSCVFWDLLWERRSCAGWYRKYQTCSQEGCNYTGSITPAPP